MYVDVCVCVCVCVCVRACVYAVYLVRLDSKSSEIFSAIQCDDYPNDRSIDSNKGESG